MSKDFNRRPNGRFGPGNDGGNGRPKREVEAEYLNATVNAVSIEAWAKVVSSMLHFAQAGNVQCATWLANYIVGRPTERIAVEDGNSDVPIFLTLPGRGLTDEGENEPPALPAPTPNGEE